MITGVINVVLIGRKVLFVTYGNAQKVHAIPQIQGDYHLFHTGLVFSYLTIEQVKIMVFRVGSG